MGYSINMGNNLSCADGGHNDDGEIVIAPDHLKA